MNLVRQVGAQEKKPEPDEEVEERRDQERQEQAISPWTLGLGMREEDQKEKGRHQHSDLQDLASSPIIHVRVVRQIEHLQEWGRKDKQASEEHLRCERPSVKKEPHWTFFLTARVGYRQPMLRSMVSPR